MSLVNLTEVRPPRSSAWYEQEAPAPLATERKSSKGSSTAPDVRPITDRAGELAGRLKSLLTALKSHGHPATASDWDTLQEAVSLLNEVAGNSGPGVQQTESKRRFSKYLTSESTGDAALVELMGVEVAALSESFDRQVARQSLPTTAKEFAAAILSR